MPRETPGQAQPASDEPEVINDPGNEDPGSLQDDARVPLQEAPEGDKSPPGAAD
ncbi:MULTISPECIES: hypothetical protein [Pseudomonas]|nr:conserved hypothetical protein [Pseudomonas protegens Pf-5]MBF0642682.1 hypothetical protein [Pseudomonas protegens]MCS4260422.1 hypothetical protein [Pseudomonas sp. BIGb0176]GED78643.1 hypothetical protein PFL02_54930 [Pseudomonas fluorescens]MBP5095803.1 hypothetical protein [Pseudomonas protegens]